MKIIGLMSGTSVDGVDAALCELGPDGQFKILATHYTEYPAKLRSAIHALCEQDAPGQVEIDDVDRQLVQKFANAVDELLKASHCEASDIAVIGSHGQTIRHCPHCPQPYSLQIGDPQSLASTTGIATVGDFRTADIRAGGQGAPLAPAFHYAVFRSPDVSRAILNIGGIANVTYLPAAPNENVIGFDTGPGNTLMDYWVRKTLDRAYDDNGAWAAGGTINRTLLALLLSEPYFSLPPPKSTGRELFSSQWLQSRLAQLPPDVPAQDVAATLLALTVQSISDAIRNFLPDSAEVYVCGGGSHNRSLISGLRQQLGGRAVDTTQALGIDADWVEACAFAWLAAQNLAGKPGNLPTVTGAREPTVLGKLFRP